MEYVEALKDIKQINAIKEVFKKTLRERLRSLYFGD